MGYLFKGNNPETGQTLETHFEEYEQAEEFADDSYSEFPQFKVVDLENNEVVYSTKILEDRLDEMMFLDEE